MVDGDTIRADVDLGFHTWLHDVTFRLLRIDAPEKNTPEGKEAATWLAQYLMGRDLVATTHKGDSFGRWLCNIKANGIDVADAMVQAGQAQYKFYA